MPVFSYQAKNSLGATVEGTAEHDSREECVRSLLNEGLFILTIKEGKPSAINSDIMKLDVGLILSKMGKKQPTKELALFCSNINFLLESGLSIYQSIGLVKNQSTKVAMRQALAKVESDLDLGSSFHEALAKHENVFPTLLVELVKTGEVSGNLERIMEELASYYEEQSAIKSQIVTVMFYPVLTIILAIAVVNYILLTVVPSIADMLIKYDAELPFVTKVVMTGSDLIQNYWYYVLGVTILLIIALRYVLKIGVVRENIDKILLKIPVISALLLQVNLSRFTRTLAILLDSGINVVRAMDMSSKILSNRILYKGVIDAKELVEQGESVSSALGKSKGFPEIFIEIVKVGEKSGSIDRVLFKVADQYSKALEQNVKRLSAVLEPFLMLFVAGIVGFLMISMFMPMVSLMNSIR